MKFFTNAWHTYSCLSKVTQHSYQVLLYICMLQAQMHAWVYQPHLSYHVIQITMTKIMLNIITAKYSYKKLQLNFGA